jgi:uncharacterized protein
MPMSQPAKAPEPKVPEPSIDEILASIRRSIVPDDDAGKPSARKPGSRKAASAPMGTAAASGGKGHREDGETARADANGAGDQGTGKPTRPVTDTGADEGATSQNGEGGVSGSDPGRGGENIAPSDPAGVDGAMIGLGNLTGKCLPGPTDPLLSPQTTAAVDTAFTSLAHTMLSHNPRTLEDLVREMLKPMLKAWLDANLPDMVERLVRAEIERVSRRG